MHNTCLYRSSTGCGLACCPVLLSAVFSLSCVLMAACYRTPTSPSLSTLEVFLLERLHSARHMDMLGGHLDRDALCVCVCELPEKNNGCVDSDRPDTDPQLIICEQISLPLLFSQRRRCQIPAWVI